MTAKVGLLVLRPRTLVVLVTSLLVESVLIHEAANTVPAAANDLTWTQPATQPALAEEQQIGAALTAVALTAALAAWTSWCVSVLTALRLTERSPGNPAPGRGSRWVRAAALALGVGAAGLVAGPASADAGPPQSCAQPVELPPERPPGAGRWWLDGLHLPVLPAAPRAAPIVRTHVVASGDSLWSLASSRLEPAASVSAVDRLWRRWYATNRDVIGPDPDVLTPGQRLRVPLAHPHDSGGPTGSR